MSSSGIELSFRRLSPSPFLSPGPIVPDGPCTDGILRQAEEADASLLQQAYQLWRLSNPEQSEHLQSGSGVLCSSGSPSIIGWIEGDPELQRTLILIEGVGSSDVFWVGEFQEG